MLVIKDIDDLLHAPSGLPLIQLYYQATGNRLITILLMIAFTICFFACAVAIITASSRSLWSAARDECFPRSDMWKKISERFEMPLNAVLLQAMFLIVSNVVRHSPRPLWQRQSPSLTEILALRARLSWLRSCLLAHGQRLHHLPRRILCYPAGDSIVCEPRRPAPSSAFPPRSFRIYCQPSLDCLGRLLNRGVLYTH
jgi:hypothetical protein